MKLTSHSIDNDTERSSDDIHPHHTSLLTVSSHPICLLTLSSQPISLPHVVITSHQSPHVVCSAANLKTASMSCRDVNLRRSPGESPLHRWATCSCHGTRGMSILKRIEREIYRYVCIYLNKLL